MMMVENFGAEKGIVLLYDIDTKELMIEVIFDIESIDIKLKRISYQASEELSIKIIDNVLANRGEPLLITDAQRIEEYQSDKYVIKHKIKSVLCSPIRHQGEIIGVIYLENISAEACFNEDTTKIIELLSSHAGVSIQNAHLYQHLERQVNARTAEINSILSNIKQGIFSILPDKFEIHEHYSSYLEEIFEMDSLAGKNAFDILFKYSNLSSDELSIAKSVLSNCLGYMSDNFVCNSHLLPKEVVIGKQKNNHTRILALEWYPIENDENIVEKILVSVRDITRLRSLEIESQKQSQELQIVKEIINVEEGSFESFMERATEFIESNRETIRRSICLNETDLRKMNINLHTLKGNSRCLNFREIAETVHDAEQYLSEFTQSNSGIDNKKLISDLDRISEKVDRYRNIAISKLKRGNGTVKDGAESDFYKEKIEILMDRIKIEDVEKEKQEVFAHIVHVLKTGDADRR
ncbi:MAG: GAF domain-containing protein [Oligoflexales bacterium]|nr:GAF domain-containing protein [Oligoflexales bacterium]